MATTYEVEIGHRSSIAGAYWCKPIDWAPANQIDAAEFIDGSWWTDDEEIAGIVCFQQGEKGDCIEVTLDDLRVASCGDCRIIAEIQLKPVHRRERMRRDGRA